MSAFTVQGFAHPHILIDAQVQFLFNAQNQLEAIRYHWMFDKAFSSYLTQELDVNKDGVYEQEELRDLAQINVESLEEYSYFTEMSLISNKKDSSKDIELSFQKPENYSLLYENDHLVLSYTLRLDEAFSFEHHQLFSLDLYDPEYFIAFNYRRIDPLQNIPEACEAHLKRPQILSDDIYESLAAIPADGDLSDDMRQITSGLINHVELSCVF